uniref:Uncharacterized protein n=1 Tax=Ixodes ricinus TaxID=34613 RepID=A0A6B0U1B4_IXORI
MIVQLTPPGLFFFFQRAGFVHAVPVGDGLSIRVFFFTYGHCDLESLSCFSSVDVSSNKCLHLVGKLHVKLLRLAECPEKCRLFTEKSGWK